MNLLRQWLTGLRRADRDHRTGAYDHVETGLEHIVAAEQIDIDHRLEAVRRNTDRGRHEITGGTCNDHARRANPLHRVREQRRHRREVAHIGAPPDRGGAGLVLNLPCRIVGLCSIAAEDQQPCPLCGKTLCDAEVDAARAA